jgi:hypothetical protein
VRETWGIPDSPLPVPQTQSAFHPHAQRNAFRPRDVRLQSRLFVLRDPQPTDSPQLHPAFADIVSDYFPVLHAADRASFALHTTKGENDMNGRDDYDHSLDYWPSA